MSEQSITAKILSVIQQIEVKKVLGGLKTQVKTAPAIVSRGVKEIERLELNKPSVVSKDAYSIRRVVTEQTVLKVSNIGPQGARGDQGPMGLQGEAGDIDNFIMDDLTSIFRGRLS